MDSESTHHDELRRLTAATDPARGEALAGDPETAELAAAYDAFGYLLASRESPADAERLARHLTAGLDPSNQPTPAALLRRRGPGRSSRAPAVIAALAALAAAILVAAFVWVGREGDEPGNAIARPQPSKAKTLAPSIPPAAPVDVSPGGHPSAPTDGSVRNADLDAALAWNDSFDEEASQLQADIAMASSDWGVESDLSDSYQWQVDIFEHSVDDETL